MPQETESFDEPRPVWVWHSDKHWYAGRSLGRRRWPGGRWYEYDVTYLSSAGETVHRAVKDYDLCSRRPMAEPEKNAACARCGSSREDCDRREQTERPPYCCPQCWRSQERYAQHVRAGGRPRSRRV